MWDQGVMSAMGRLYADIFMDGPRQHGGMGSLWAMTGAVGVGARCGHDHH